MPDISKIVRISALLSILMMVSLPQLQVPPLPSPSIRLGTDPQGPVSSLDDGTDPNLCSPCLVRLVTGDRFYVWGDRQGTILNVVMVRNQTTSEHSYIVSQRGGETYMFPSSFDRSKLDSRFFDLSYLLRSGYDKLGFLPLIVHHSTTETRVFAETSTPTPPGHASDRREYTRLDVTEQQSPSVITSLTSDPEVEYVYLDGIVRSDILDETSFLRSVGSLNYPGSVYPSNGTGNSLIGAQAAWKRGLTGSGIRVALLDTGIWENHPDFFFPNGTSKIIYERDFTDDNSTFDFSGHGTWTASILAGTGTSSGGLFTGTAPSVKLLDMKVLNHKGIGFESWVAAGIQDAITNAAEIISMSLGGTSSPLIDEAVANASSHGIIVVAAAGNDGPTYFTGGSPAEAPTAIAVAASSIPSWFSSPPQESLLWFSNAGPFLSLDQSSIAPSQSSGFVMKPDLVAPGWQIVGARSPASDLGKSFQNVPGYNGLYFALSGTSAATPHAAGALALLKEAYPDWPSNLVVDDLLSTSTLLNNGWYSSFQFNPLLGPNPLAGRINATYPLDVYRQGAGRINLDAALSPTVIFTPARIQLFNVQQTDQASTRLYNPTSVTLHVHLHLLLQDMVTGLDASNIATLSKSLVTIPPRGTVTVTIQVDPHLVRASFYGGYILASNEEDGKPLAHAFLGFYELRPLQVNALDHGGAPLDGGVLTLNPRNSTWFSYSYYAPQSIQLNSTGEATLPVLDGLTSIVGAAGTSCSESFCSQFVAGEINIGPSRTSLLLDGRESVRVTFDPAVSRTLLFVVVASFGFTDMFLNNPFGNKEWNLQLSLFTEAEGLPQIPTYIPATSEANSLQLGFEYETPTSYNQGSIFYPSYEFENLHSSMTITADYTNLVTKTNFFREAPFVLPDRTVTGLASTSPELSGIGFGASLDVRIPSNFTEYLSPNSAYLDTQSYAHLRISGRTLEVDIIPNIIEFYNTTGPGTVMADDFNRRPVFVPSEVEAVPVSVRESLLQFGLGPLITSEGEPSPHQLFNEGIGSLYVNGTLVSQESASYWPYTRTVTGIEAPTNIAIYYDTVTGSSKISKTTLGMTFSIDGTSGQSSSQWGPPPLITDLQVHGLDSFNNLPEGKVPIYFTVETQARAPLSNRMVQFSTDEGVSWYEISNITLQNRIQANGLIRDTYQITLPSLRHVALSLRIQLTNILGGRTVLTELNMIGVQYFLPPEIDISTSPGARVLQGDLQIQGSINSSARGLAEPVISDSRFYLASWTLDSGRFTFRNITKLPLGNANLTISFTDLLGQNASVSFTYSLRTPPPPNDSPPAIPFLGATILAYFVLHGRAVIGKSRLLKEIRT